jgi:hypothetical protein
MYEMDFLHYCIPDTTISQKNGRLIHVNCGHETVFVVDQIGKNLLISWFRSK